MRPAPAGGEAARGQLAGPTAPDAGQWPAASRKRRLLAGYLDYLLAGAPLAVAAWVLTESWPELQGASWSIRLIFFLVLEAILLTRLQWSPGFHALGIVAFRRSPFTIPSDPQAVPPAYLVEPGIHSHERWWTMLLGVLLILDGAKAAVRWTMWHAPMPVLGMELPDPASVAFQILLGACEILVGAGILRLAPFAAPLGMGLYGFQLVSVIVGWRMLPGWVAGHVAARRAWQGRPVRPDEVALMQMLVPVVLVASLILLMGWLFLAGRIVRRAGQSGGGASGA